MWTRTHALARRALRRLTARRGMALAGLCLAVTGLLSAVAYQAERNRWQSQFERSALSWAESLQSSVRYQLAMLEHMSDLLGHPPQVQPDRFRALTQRFLPELPEIDVIAWAPRAESDRAESFAIAAAEPAAVTDALIGYRPGIQRAQRELIEKALAQQTTIASGRLITPRPDKVGASVLLIRPVLDSDGTAKGLLLASYGLTSWIKALSPATSEQLDIHLFDASAGQTLLHSDRLRGDWRNVFSSTLAPQSLTRQLHYATTIAVADRDWLAVLTPSDQLRAQRSHWGTVAVWLIGGLLAIVIARGRPTRPEAAPEPAPATTPQAPPRSQLIAHQHDCLERLRRSEGLFRALIEDSPEIIAHLDANGEVLYVSPSCRETLGLEPEELIGRSLFDLLHPDDVLRAQHALQRGLLRPGIYSAHFRARRADGDYCWLDSLSRVITDPQTGDAIGFIGIARDGARRHREVQALRDRETLYRSVFDTSPQPAMVVAADGHRLLCVNHALCNLLGYSKSEMRELRACDISHPADAHLPPQLAARAWRTSVNRFSAEMRYLRKDGSTVWAIVHMELVREINGKPHYLVCHLFDITARHAGQRELAGLESHAEQQRLEV